MNAVAQSEAEAMRLPDCDLCRRAWGLARELQVLLEQAAAGATAAQRYRVRLAQSLAASIAEELCALLDEQRS